MEPKANRNLNAIMIIETRPENEPIMPLLPGLPKDIRAHAESALADLKSALANGDTTTESRISALRRRESELEAELARIQSIDNSGNLREAAQAAVQLREQASLVRAEIARARAMLDDSIARREIVVKAAAAAAVQTLCVIARSQLDQHAERVVDLVAPYAAHEGMARQCLSLLNFFNVSRARIDGLQYNRRNEIPAERLVEILEAALTGMDLAGAPF